MVYTAVYFKDFTVYKVGMVVIPIFDFYFL